MVACVLAAALFVPAPICGQSPPEPQAPSASADKLTPQQRAELRKKVQEQLQKKPDKQPLSPEQFKQLQGELDKRVQAQLKDDSQRPEKKASSSSSRLVKNSQQVLSAFREVVAAANRATVRIRCDGKDACLGAVVAADGWILTKASELKGVVTCKLADGRELPARTVGIHDDTDLAMLRIDAEGLPVVKWAPQQSQPIVGDWVAAAGLGDLPTAVGVVSVLPRRVSGRRGVLGIMLEQAEGGPKIVQITPNSGAAKAGLLVNDIVLSVDGLRTKSREELVELVGTKYKPGDVLSLVIKRGDKELTIKAAIGKVPTDDRASMQNTMGGPLSERRTNFPEALQHDTVLKPIDCGGPLVDLDGRVVGLNIARGGRVDSYALPATLIQSLLADLKSGRWAPFGEYEKQLAEAMAALKAAEESVQQARTDLEKIVSDAQAAVKKVEAARAAAAKAVQDAKLALEHARASQRGGR